ncbi:MAG: hypothetical protein JWP06_950 [Candidatus Saccharibacteria bacterium]|nr:hypothetical protein [Candidatus Saccharibacteria bacterium]
MPKRMTDEEMDMLVLEALRAVARRGARARIRGKAVREAAPLNGVCVYVRVAAELEKLGVEIPPLFSPDLASQFRLMLVSMKRLTSNDMLFNHGGGDFEDRRFWVVME